MSCPQASAPGNLVRPRVTLASRTPRPSARTPIQAGRQNASPAPSVSPCPRGVAGLTNLGHRRSPSMQLASDVTVSETDSLPSPRSTDDDPGPLNVLLVDDEPDMASVAGEALRDAG